jgi:multiple sugar transport system ATP-binding protein
MTFSNVSKVYPPKAIAVDGVSLTVGDGELLALVGPSGCGKTTMLRLIAGLEMPTSGTITINGRIVNHVSPAERDIGMVFQRPALYPHRTVRDNLGFSLNLRLRGGRGRGSIEPPLGERVSAISRLLGLDGLLDRLPAQLSGGQQQRVAVGRALVRRPGVLLLDEPLSNLDAVLRQELRRELHLLQRQFHATMVYVTHDPMEAMSLGDLVAVMDNGHLHQIGRPDVVLREPVNRFVAGFVGWPQMNFFDGTFDGANGNLRFVCATGSAPVPASRSGEWGGFTGKIVTLGIRPEDVSLVDGEVSDAWPMRVRLVEPWGDGTLTTLTSSAETAAWCAPVCQMLTRMNTMRPGSNVMVRLRLENGYVFDAATGKALTASPTG